ncbi:MAG: short-chain dehydrogenase/reductase [Anaerocolumna sp.]|jgi:NAD(P)-dependent dehydrogenase (short-subunit alcohol dehydrogenase family)|nr:short-chain dehydrogenase/reductase [Anaerocolumna sp.]
MSKNIFVAGASRGLGFFIAKKYLEDGHKVFAGVRNTSSSEFKDLQDKYPDTLLPVIIEVRDTNSLTLAAKTVSEKVDNIDILINNAGVHCDSSFEILEDTNLDDSLFVYDVNAMGPMRVAKAFLTLLRKKGGKVINISSESGSIGDCKREKEFDYCMSKAALNMGTKLLSNYLRKDNIMVLTIQPGWMRTDMGGANAALDPYETACKLVSLFDGYNDMNAPIFIDNEGQPLPW